MDCTINALDHQGRGVCHPNGKTVAVPFTLPGDVVRVALRGKQKGVHRGAIEEIITPSPDRVQPPCPFAGRCGGCPWQMMDGAAQIRHKRDRIADALRDIPHPPIPDPIPSPDQWYFRNRMDYAVGADGSLGLREPGKWWEVLNLETCLLMSQPAVACMDAFRAWMRTNAIAPWNTRTHEGFARALVLREGKHTGERMAVVITAAPPQSTAAGTFPGSDALVRALAPHCTSVLWGVQSRVADVSFASHYETLLGSPVLHEELHIADDPPLTYTIPPNAFFQTNTRAAEQLVATVREYAALTPTETLVDLCCGVGTFAIALARDAGRVIGVELEESAVAVAQENAHRNGVEHAEFHHLPAEQWLFPNATVDCLIVDPPRSGLHPNTRASILANPPRRIVYVSCNPHALAEDLRVLGERYKIARIQPIDLFPHSPHVETVALLT
ncbi:MAG: 23S rRNA (uracil(1939)-C(5))-methyltransferase RlmD [bacterium]|nr:23S rRNA (uracil(1939)-C(5))-methyltransferase RlmD [bacterium]